MNSTYTPVVLPGRCPAFSRYVKAISRSVRSGHSRRRYAMVPRTSSSMTLCSMIGSGFEQDGIIYVDQVSAIKYEYDRQKPITYTVSVGDDTQETDPFAQGIKALQAVYTLVSAVVGEGIDLLVDDAG